MSYPDFFPRPFPVPVVRAEELIPKGPYCYTPLAAPSEKTDWAYKVKLCPFWKRLGGYADAMDGWCDYLKTGDMVEDGTNLLFDQVKECGVNNNDLLHD